MCKESYYKGYKIEIFPDEDQKIFIDKCINLSIYVYNWALEQQNTNYTLYKQGKSSKKFLTEFDLDKLFSIHRNQNEWLKDLPLTAGRYQIRNVIRAFKNFFDGRTNRPVFKSKKHLRKYSYHVRPDTMYFDDSLLRIEGLPRRTGKVKTKWKSGFTMKSDIKYYQPVITRTGLGKYYISFSILEDKPIEFFEVNKLEKSNRAIGIDLNVKDRFVCSNGYRSGSPNLNKLLIKEKKYNRKFQRGLRILRKLERTNLTSNRQEKRLNRYRKVYNKITNVIENFIQTETKKIICMNPTAIVMETLEVKRIERKHYIAKLTHLAKFYRCKNVMKTKCFKFNIPFIEANKTFPSSQLCSNCGNRINIGKSKVYNCPKCGLVIDRDLNAALNLEHLAYC